MVQTITAKAFLHVAKKKVNEERGREFSWRIKKVKGNVI